MVQDVELWLADLMELLIRVSQYPKCGFQTAGVCQQVKEEEEVLSVSCVNNAASTATLCNVLDSLQVPVHALDGLDQARHRSDLRCLFFILHTSDPIWSRFEFKPSNIGKSSIGILRILKVNYVRS